MCIECNRRIALERAEKAGFGIGTKVKYRREVGVVIGVNAHFHDSVVVMVYVLLEGERVKDLVDVTKLKVLGECHG